jgi:hypothetical protein
MAAGIYLVSGLAPNAVNVGDYGYFGLSVEPERRIDAHLGKLRHNAHENPLIQDFYNDHGKNHIIYTVVENCDVDELAAREKYHIKQGNTFENPLGFNQSRGGEGVGLREGKFFCFEDTENNLLITGQNLAMFVRANPQFNLQQLYRVSRGQLESHQNLIWKTWPQ